MVCFIVPLAGAIIASLFWGVQNRGPAAWWLNLLLYGGAVFGMVDHVWHGEFLIGLQNLASGSFAFDDLMLGVVITGTIFTGWGITLGIARINTSLGQRMGLIENTQDV